MKTLIFGALMGAFGAFAVFLAISMGLAGMGIVFGLGLLLCLWAFNEAILEYLPSDRIGYLLKYWHCAIGRTLGSDIRTVWALRCDFRAGGCNGLFDPD